MSVPNNTQHVPDIFFFYRTSVTRNLIRAYIDPGRSDSLAESIHRNASIGMDPLAISLMGMFLRRKNDPSLVQVLGIKFSDKQDHSHTGVFLPVIMSGLL